MPNINYVTPTGETITIDVPAKTSIMEGAIQNGVDGIVAECGGSCMCATCHVYVDEKFLGLLQPIEAEENAMLECTAADRLPNSRLSCQLFSHPTLEGMTVRTPPTQK